MTKKNRDAFRTNLISRKKNLGNITNLLTKLQIKKQTKKRKEKEKPRTWHAILRTKKNHEATQTQDNRITRSSRKNNIYTIITLTKQTKREIT